MTIYLCLDFIFIILPAVQAISVLGMIVRPSMGFGVREIQPTPNPNAMKFVLDAIVSEEPASFYSREQAGANPAEVNRLAEKLLAIQGVSNVLLLNDFVTVGKLPQARWSDINGRVKQILAQAIKAVP
jgi:hypothetical protein